MKNTMKRIVVFASLALFMIGCSEESPVEQLPALTVPQTYDTAGFAAASKQPLCGVLRL